jgi:hypothetical protein
MRASSGRGVVTPDLAQQAGVLPCRQRQHNRKESCSKHVMLAIPKGQELRQPERVGISENPDVFSGSPSPGKAICGLFRSVPKIPQRVALATAELAGPSP